MFALQEIILVAIVLAALALIISNRFRVDVVAILVLLALALSGLVTVDEAISGFSRTAVIVIIGMFVITHALEETGIVQSISGHIRTLGRGSEKRLVVVVMATGALLVLVMNIIAAGAVLLPAVVRVARDSDVRPSRLLIPMSYGTLVGAMATFFSSANIVMSAILQERGFAGLGFLDFFLTGAPIVVVSLLYMVLIGRRLLPERESVTQIVNPRGLMTSMRQTYQLDERLWEFRVPPGSRLIGSSLQDSHIGADLGILIVAIWRGHQAILTPASIQKIEVNDYLLVVGREDRVRQLAKWGLLIGRENGYIRNGHDYSVDLTEVIIPPRSASVGKTLADLHFRNKFGLTSVALWREGRSYRTDVGKMPLQVGDALLMVGPSEKIRKLTNERDYMLLQSSHIYQPPSPEKNKWALLITGLVLVAAIFNFVPLPIAVLAGWVAIIFTGIMTMDSAYRAVEWRVVFLIAGMLPIGIAMANTGLADRIGMALVEVLAPTGPLALIAGLYLLTVLVTQLLGGQVTALIIGPIAITAAIQAGVDPHPMAVAVGIGCATGFLTPIAHPVNVLMMGPGGYKFEDFTRVGIGMVVVVFTMLMLSIHYLWGVG